MSTERNTIGETQRMIRGGVAEQYIQAGQRLIDQFCQPGEKSGSLRLRYAMTGTARLEQLKKILANLEQTVETARKQKSPNLAKLIETAHLVRNEIVFWWKEIHDVCAEAQG